MAEYALCGAFCRVTSYETIKYKHPKGRPQYIAENIHEGRIPRGEVYLDQLDCKAERGADKEGNAVYARCGEVFNAP